MEPISHYEPDFTPVPLTRVRLDGWTPERQKSFLDVLAATGTVDSAARAVGMSRVSAYDLRRREGAESFVDAWDRALAAGRAMQMDHMIDRAVNGVTTIRLRLGGIIDIEQGPDRNLIAKALRARPAGRSPPRPANGS